MPKLTLICAGWLVLLSSALADGYDPRAKSEWSHNDVKAFVYQWFAGFDHQRELDYFLAKLPATELNMQFPDWPIKNRDDFTKWYMDVIDNIRYNEHHLVRLDVTGNEQDGWQVDLSLRWVAVTYAGEHFDVNVLQQWRVEASQRDGEKVMVITKHNAQMAAPSS